MASIWRKDILATTYKNHTGLYDGTKIKFRNNCKISKQISVNQDIRGVCNTSLLKICISDSKEMETSESCFTITR